MVSRKPKKRNGLRAPSATLRPAGVDPIAAAARFCVEELEGRLLLSAASDSENLPAPFLPQQHNLTQFGGFLSGPASGKPLDIAVAYLTAHAADLGIAPADLATPIVTDQYTDLDSGVTHIYLRQRYNGLEVSNANLSINLTRDGRVINASSGFIGGLGGSGSGAQLLTAPVAPAISASQALQDAAAALGLNLRSLPTVVSRTGVSLLAGTTYLSAPDVATGSVPAKLHYVWTPDGVKLAWDLVIDTSDREHWYDASVDASAGTGGAMIDVNDWVDHATYNVIPLPNESLNEGTRALVTDPNDPIYSPYGWNDTNGVAGAEYTYTRGNNTFAYLDRNNDNLPDSTTTADGGTALNFDFPLDTTQAPTTASNQAAAVTNLFYLVNTLHDIHARYGFTEAAGNFQTTDYSGQGLGGDAVLAEAQDGGGTNNANFATPPDGQAGRMQMYLWNSVTPNRDGDLDNGIVIHEFGHGVSNRLTGGPANANALSATQSGGMGEGWSDFWALMLTQRPTDTQNQGYALGTYALGQTSTGAGIRRHPYSYNMTIDPETWGLYGSGGDTEVHDTGELWTTTLWDLNWLMIQKYGYGTNVAGGYDPFTAGENGGNNLTLKLVMDALKLQPANPSFVDARNAILAADQALNGGLDQLQIWQAFARRGLGYSAVDASANATTVTTATDLPPGLLNPRVSASTPTGTQTTAISSLDFTFSKAMDPTSFAVAADVATFTGPGGVDLKSQITGFTWLNSNTTLHVTFTAQSTDGQYAMVIGPQILATDGTAMDQNGNGTAGEATVDQYTAKFGYDSLPMQVQSTTPVPGTTISLPFITLDVKFNEAYDPATLGITDLTLSKGTVTAATAVDATTVRYTLSNVTTEGPLLVTMAAGALNDTDGNPMLSFSGTYTLDIGTVAFPAFNLSLPLGSQIATQTMSGTISPAGDTDTFTFVADPGQLISLVVHPTAVGGTLAPSLLLTDSNGNVLATAATVAAGSDALIQTYAATTGGTYQVVVGGSAGTVGGYTVQAVLNAAVEGESHNLAANSTQATAENLDPAFGAFSAANSAAARAAVLGSTAVSPGDSVDVYKFSLNQGDTVSAGVIFTTGSTTGTLTLTGPDGKTITLGSVPGTRFNKYIADVVAPATGTYYLTIDSLGTASIYDLTVVKDAALSTGANITTTVPKLLLSRSNGGTQTVTGHIDSAATLEYYKVTAAAGATITLSTATPGDGAGEPLNTFNPRLRLLNASLTQVALDDNSAPDGRNAQLSYTVTTAGTYFIEVSSTTTTTTTGDYVLTVGGVNTAPAAFTATVTNAANNAFLPAGPPTLTVVFSDSVNLSSITAASLLIDGVPAASVSVSSGTIVIFTPASPIGVGPHTLSIAAGAAKSIQGVALTALNSTFTVDNVPPRVIASSIQEGDVKPVGALTYTVTFSEPMLVTVLDSTDFSLLGVTKNISYTPGSYSYNAAGTVLTLNYASLPEDQYTLTLLSATGRFQDPAGNLLDGEPVWPIPAAGTGNGTAGGNFFVDFSTDVNTAAFPVSLAAVNPLGGGVYSGTTSGLISPVGDTDTFTLLLDAGSNLTLLATGNGGLTPTVTLLSPTGITLGTVTASGSNLAALLQAVPITAAGTYTIVVSGAAGTTGSYSLTATLNAVQEAENYAPATNDTLATAQNLDSAFVTAGPAANGASRAAVLGSNTTPTGAATPLFTDDLESGLGGLVIDNTGAGLWHLSTGRSTQTGHSNTHSLYFGQNETTAGGGTYNTGTRVAGTVTTPSIALPAASVVTLDFNYVLQTEGNTGFDQAQVRISTDGGTTFTTLASYNGTAESTVWKAATELNLSTYAGQTVKLRWFFDTLDASANTYEGWYVDDINVQVTPPSKDYYSFTMAAGDSTSILLKGIVAGSQDVQLIDSAGNVLTTSATGATNVDKSIQDFIAPASGTYYALVTGTAGSTYDLVVTKNATADLEANDTVATSQLVQARQVGGVQTVLGHIDSGNADVYAVTAVAGAVLTLSTTTPGDGAGEPLNTLNPRIRVLNSAGTQLALDDNSAPDGRNAMLTYAVTTAGTYYIEVSSTTTTTTVGDYVLNIGGAGSSVPFAVASTTPAAGAVVKTAPSTFVVNFNSAVLASSLQASDLTIDGLAATAVSLNASLTTATFTLPTLPAQSSHAIALAAGSVNNLQGAPLQAYAGTLTVDGVPPRVIASSVQEGDVRAPGTLTYTVTFNEPMLAANLDSTDFSLKGLVRNITYTPASYVYSAGGTVLTITYTTSLPEDNYTLTLLSGDGRFEDVAGNDLDGEPTWPIPAAGTGNGVEGGNFFVDFTVDNPTAAFPALTAVNPAGGLIYSGAVATGLISSATDTDAFTIKVDAGQTLTLVATAAGSALRPTVDLLDAGGNVLATASAAAAGKDAVLQTFAVPVAGTYTIRISGVAGSVGTYGVQAVLNAAVEAEDHGGTDDTIATAQNIDGSFGSLGGSARRGAVAGTLAVGSSATVASDDFESGALGSAWSTYHSDTTGEIQVSGAYGVAGGKYALVMDHPGDTTIYNLNEAVWTVDLTGLKQATLNFSQASYSDEMDTLATDFTGHANGDGVAISSDGVHWHTVWSSTGSTVYAAVSIDLAAAATTAGMTLGAGFQIKFQQYDNFPLTTDGRGWDNISVTTPAAQDDYYAVTLNAGETASVAVARGGTTTGLTVRLYNAAGTLLASGANGPTNADQILSDFIAPATGVYYLRASGAVGAYSLVVTRGAEFDTEANDTLATAQSIDPTGVALGKLTGVSPAGDDYYHFTGAAGQAITLSTTTPADGAGEFLNTLDPKLTLYDPSGAIVATDDNSGPDGRNALLSFTPTVSGTYVVRVAAVGTAGGEYVLSVTGTAPSWIPSTPDLLDAADSGVSSTDNITNFNDATAAKALQFLIPNTRAGATVTVYLNGALFGTTVATGSSTTFTAPAGVQLADGVYTITATQTPPAGVESLPSQALTITVLTASPGVPVAPHLQAASDTGTSSSDSLTKLTTPIFDVTAPAYYRVYRDGTLVSGSYQSGAAFTMPALTGGAHSIRISAVDAAGNESALSPATAVVIDTSVPVVGAVSAASVTTAGAATYTFTLTYTDDTAIDTATLDGSDVRVTGPSSFSQLATLVSVDVAGNGTPRTATYRITTPGGAWSFTANGTYTIAVQSAQVNDTAGNSVTVATAGTFTVAVPVGAPTAVDLLAASDSGASSTDNITNFNNSVTARALQFSVTGTSTGATVSIFADGIQIGTAVATSATTTVATNGSTLLIDGVHSITARQTAAGQSQTADSPALPVTVDTVAPTAPVLPGLHAGSDTGVSATDNITKVTTPTVDVVAPEAGTLHVSVDGGTANTLPVNSAGTYSFLMKAPVGTVLFAPETTYASRAAGFGTVGDFNHDGRPDVITSGTNSSFNVLLGNGDGTFQAAKFTATVGSDNGIATADFNGDGNLDVVGAAFSHNAVSLMLGKGDGTFLAEQLLTAGVGGDDVAVADFNGDGKADIAVDNLTDGTISILLGNGNGTFQAQKITTVIPGFLQTGDFNNDGKADVLVAGRNTATLSLLLGNGDGTFQAAATSTLAAVAKGSVVGDFNADGKLDAAVVTLTTSYLFLGNGNGTLQAAQVVSTPGSIMSVTAGDFDRDGKLDLAVGTFGVNGVAISLGNGNGTFKAYARTTTLYQPADLAAADLNGDGAADLAVITGNLQLASVLLNTAVGALSDGTHTASVWTEDLAGNLSATQALPFTVDTTPPTIGITAVPTGATPVNTASIVFNEPTYGLTLSALQLRRNGGTNLLTAAQTLTTTDHITWTLGNLSGLTGIYGNYQLAANVGSAVTDAAGNSQATGATASWSMTGVGLSTPGLYLALDADGTDLDLWQDSATPGVGVPSQQIPMSQLSKLVVTGSAGDDTLVLDFSHGNPIPAGGLSFDGGAGVNSVSVTGSAADETLTLSNNGLTYTGDGGLIAAPPLSLTNVQGVNFVGGGGNDTLNVTGGTFAINADTPTGKPGISVNISGSGTRGLFNASQHLAALNLSGGGSAQLAKGGAVTLVTGGLTTTGGSSLDLTDNHLVVTYAAAQEASTLSAITGLITTGLYNGANGFWDGPGVNSSVAAGDVKQLHALGVVDNNDGSGGGVYGVFGDQAVTGTSLLVGYTLFGDADLNGVVNPDDFTQFLSGYHHQGPASWLNGDFDQNGVVNADDFTLLLGGLKASQGSQSGNVSASLSLVLPGPAAEASAPAVTAPQAQASESSAEMLASSGTAGEPGVIPIPPESASPPAAATNSAPAVAVASQSPAASATASSPPTPVPATTPIKTRPPVVPPAPVVSTARVPSLARPSGRGPTTASGGSRPIRANPVVATRPPTRGLPRDVHLARVVMKPAPAPPPFGGVQTAVASPPPAAPLGEALTDVLEIVRRKTLLR